MLEKFDENMEIWIRDEEGNDFPLNDVTKGKSPQYHFVLKDQSYLIGPTYPVVYIG